MAKEAQLHLDMAHARQSDGINVIFDQNSPASSHSRSRSRSRSTASSSDSSAHKGRVHRRRRYRSSSSSSSSSSRARSRSYPRCRRRSSRCRCDDHHRYGRSYYRRSPSRRQKAHSRSYSRSPSPDRSSRHRYYRSHRRSTSRSQPRSLPHSSRYERAESRYRCKVSSSRSQRSRSRSRSNGHPTSLSKPENPELLVAAKENVEKLLVVKPVELPESEAPVVSEQLSESKQSSPEPEIWVRPSPEKRTLQSDGEEPEDTASLQWSHRPVISFSINNSVVRPSLAAPPCAKVTPRVDSYESRKPYGHWIPVKSGQRSRARKRTAVKSR